MRLRWEIVASVATLGAALFACEAVAGSTVTYGRITAVRQVNIQGQGPQAAGTVIGGALGVVSGSGQSRSNRALRGVGGAAIGNQVAGATRATTGFEYTILVRGTDTIRFTTEQVGLRVGDCVSVERGQWNNIRLAHDERCDAPAGTTPPASAVAEADACDEAKRQLLATNTDEDFDRAERRMRLLCGD